VERALHEAQRAGFETIELDWRATNLLASRFWPRRGFRPTHLRLRRDVQPIA
jgi:ribosomal protein S18 acetylase RimI-like enzyme